MAIVTALNLLSYGLFATGLACLTFTFFGFIFIPQAGIEYMHPSKDIIGTAGSELSGKKIVLCMTGSVAIIRSVDLARLLMRHGAEVYGVVTQAAAKLIGPDLIEWATGNPVVTELTGAIEHVALAGNVPGKVDLVLVAPSTANTIGKIAGGIDDTPVTTTVTTALGEGIPTVVVPAMHELMYWYPGVIKNLDILKSYGITVVAPQIAEGKAKIAQIDEIFAVVRAVLGPKNPPFAGKRVLITAGRTVEYLDPVRVITNNSSGKMGMALAHQATRMGAHVRVVYGKGTAEVPPGVDVERVGTSDEMLQAVNSSLRDDRFDIMIAAAAVGDWKPRKMAREKITTHGSEGITIDLVPTEKIIDTVRERFPETYLVAFRALYDLPTNELIENAFARMNKANADLIAVNDVSGKNVGFETDTNEIYIIDRSHAVTHVPLAGKDEIAAKLLQVIAEKIRAKDI